MSVSKNRNEAMRWFKTAQDDHEIAEILLNNQKYSASCFHAQQAAEKAVKSLYYLHAQDPWGHSITKLVSGMDFLPEKKTFIELLDTARKLDQFYIPTRYPNGVPDILPSEAYGKSDAVEALAKADSIITTVQEILNSREC